MRIILGVLFLATWMNGFGQSINTNEIKDCEYVTLNKIDS